MSSPEPEKMINNYMKPKKKSKKIAPKVPPTTEPVLDTEGNPIPPLNIADLLESVKKYENTIVSKERKEHNLDMTIIANFLSEYLDDYVVIGHLANSNRTYIRYAKTAKDYDALMELSKKVLIQMAMQSEEGSNGIG